MASHSIPSNHHFSPIFHGQNSIPISFNHVFPLADASNLRENPSMVDKSQKYMFFFGFFPRSVGLGGNVAKSLDARMLELPVTIDL